MALEAERRCAVPDVRVATRTGDTPAGRAARHRPPPARHPRHHARVALPDAHVGRPARCCASVEYVIVDEIHAVAATKRGAHLALSLERLERLVPSRPRRSASACRPRSARSTRWPASSAAGPTAQARPVTVVDAGVRKELDLEVVVPVDDMGELGKPDRRPDGEPVLSGPAAGDPEVAPLDLAGHPPRAARPDPARTRRR